MVAGKTWFMAITEDCSIETMASADSLQVAITTSSVLPGTQQKTVRL